METSQQPEELAPEAAPAMSAPARLFNVFTDPAEVFATVKAGPPRPVNWVAPLIAMLVATILYCFICFSQPAVVENMMAGASQKMDEYVSKGKMTQQQVDQSFELAKRVTPYVASFSIIIGVTIKLFAGALIVFLIARFAFHAQTSYAQALEVCGLATMIAAVGMLISIGLVVGFGSLLATPGPVLFVGTINSVNHLHKVLSALSVFSIWELVAVAIGLSVVTGASRLKAALWLFGLWIILVLLPSAFLG